MTEFFARKWMVTSSISQTPGARLLQLLDAEADRVARQQSTIGDHRVAQGQELNEWECQEYAKQLRAVHGIMGDSLMSAVHRDVMHYHLNRGLDAGAYHVCTDEEEISIVHDPVAEDEEEDDLHSTDGDRAGAAHGAAATAGKAAQQASVDSKARRREETKRKRLEDENLLKQKQVRNSEKTSNMLATIGPYQHPRLTIRSIKQGQPVPSRRLLTQRPNVEQHDTSEASTSSDDEEALAAAAASSSVLTIGDNADRRLAQFLSPLSMDSLKKVSESAKVKPRAGASHEEMVQEIARAAVKMGCEKACVFMDKHKVLDKVMSHTRTSRTHILTQLATSIPVFIESLPADLQRLLSPTLGIPSDATSVPEIWERIVAMGLCAVLTHLRPRPLKKIAQELSITLNESHSTEKHCEQIVCTLFPRERLRIKRSKMSKRVPGVAFVVSESLPARCLYDMGFISFTVLNVSQMRTDMGERHYSPEFEFGSLRWSLLCMSTKDALALYLCQQGTVHCKFTISVVNANPDDYVYNEGTQEFKSSSSENDWGFNNVIKFDQLLDAKNGFWNAENDSITVEVGIVLVENVKPPAPAPAQQQAAKHDAPAQNVQGGGAGGGAGGGGGGGGKGKNAKGAAAQADNRLLTELLEAERLDGIKKKIKHDMGRLVKEEERLRREMTTKASKDATQLLDQCAREEQRIHKEQQDRERREQQERVREQEKIRVLQEQHTELRRRTAELTEEHTELQGKRKTIGGEVKDLKQVVDASKDATAACDQKLEELRAKRAALLAKLEERRNRLKDVHSEIDSKPPVVAAAAAAITEDNEILRSVQQSLASVMDW